MAVFPLYSKRQKKLRGEVPDVYQYEDFPDEFKVQVIFIINEALTTSESINENIRDITYKNIVDILCREYGKFNLSETRLYNHTRNYENEIQQYFLATADPDKILDVIELFFNSFSNLPVDHKKFEKEYPFLYSEKHYKTYQTVALNACKELNIRFKEHGIGYQYENEIIKIDSQLIHHEAVKPALHLLSNPQYSGAQEEFLSAFNHYRHRKYQETLVDALKSIESTIKIICDKQGWQYNKTDPFKNLLKICYDQELIPSFWQSNMTGLRAILEGGVPTARNKLGGHGQGADPVDIPDHLASYVLHMTASAIVFLVKSEQAI